MSDSSILPSRRQAIAALVQALEQGDGPILLTGEPGVGKTWVHRRARETISNVYHWVENDLTSTLDPIEFHRVILQSLGYDSRGGLAEARGLLADFLVDSSHNEELWVLVLEESHNASPAVLEEVRVLGNRLGEPDGFAGIVIVGQNALIRRLIHSPGNALGSRLAGRVHLRPLKFDEFREWVSSLEPSTGHSESDFEQLYRAIGGNPRRYLIETRQAIRPRTAIDRAEVASSIDSTDSHWAEEVPALSQPTSNGWEVASALPQKPPLEVAEEMIEVGWDASSEFPLEPDDASDSRTDMQADPSGKLVTSRAEEVVDDHYAALQAWTEWSRNQGREPVIAAGRFEKYDVAEHDLDSPDQLPADESPWPSPSIGTSGNRVEPQHTFAPYSQLFSRLKEPRETAE